MGARHEADSVMPGRYAARNVRKTYGAVQVLKGVSLELEPGRVVTIMGENGAGKSTLFKILAGQVPPTDGTLSLDGATVPLSSPSAAHARGIYLVPQEPALLPELSVAETMFAGALPTRRGPANLFGRVDWAAMRARAREALDALELPIEVDRLTRILSIAQQQQVECAKAGRHVVQHLVEHGYQVLNLDTKPLDNPSVRTLITDITDSGQVDGALSSYMGLHEFDSDLSPQPADAVVHFAAIPRIMLVPDNEVYRINVMGTYNVIEAACKLGIRKVIIASSETTYGLVFNHTHRDPDHFPLDETYPVDPRDSCATSKICNEKTAQAFAGRTGADVYAIRIGNVVEPDEYRLFPGFFAKPDFRKRIAWSNIDARDLGQIVRLAIEKDGLGFQIFNAVNDHISSDLPTAELLRRYDPGVPVKGDLGAFEGLLSNHKAKDVLGFREAHNWRREVPGY